MSDTGVYGEKFAALYDLFHGQKDYAAEARFVREMADTVLGGRRTTLRVLDLACGTGSHAIALTHQNCEVTGVDSSRAMLRRAKKKAAAAGARARFLHGDLAALHLPFARWDVATCLFDSLGYLRTNTRIGSALRSIYKSVRPGGVIVLEVWHAPAMLQGFERLRVRRFRGKGIEAVRIGETRLFARNMAEVRYEVFSRSAGESWERFEEAHVNRFFDASEIEALTEAAGFRSIQVFGAFNASVPMTDAAWHLVVVGRRPE
jgi:ubiquinone/menaquinone biosynthesis C-methylase UbiE